MKIKKAIIPAAGLGTRFLPATKAQPKEMLPIVDKPAIQYIIEEAVESGIEEILIITGRNKSSIEDHFDLSFEIDTELRKKKYDLLQLLDKISNLAQIYYTRQKEPKGLGHALLCAKAFVGEEPFAVMLGDDIVDSCVPCLKQLIDIYNKVQSSIVGVQEVPRSELNKYGVVSGRKLEKGLYMIEDLIEKPEIDKAPSNIAILGRYIITPKIFDLLENTVPGINGEIQLTDALKKLLEFEPIYAYIFAGKRYDIGDKIGFLKANVEFALKQEDTRKDFLSYLRQEVDKDTIEVFADRKRLK
ncbi:MAG: UTP--glucose-1-phosphate uridylyltransferase [Clostridiales bacterium GWB2_37_7]|nr:MAG: UTP--glucose-1-phosphate uridylyltransferase [Clostridiales bacterium GWB2_37_7]